MSRRGSRKSVVVIGSGAWGTTLGLLALRAGQNATLFVRNPFAAAVIRETRRNERHLPGVELPTELRISSDLEDVYGHADLVVLAVPSQSMRGNARSIRHMSGQAMVVSAAKGLEQDTLLRMTEVVAEELTGVSVCALSGPNLAREIALGKPATSVLASNDLDTAERARDLLMSDHFRCYTNEDVIGVEMGGALKNIIAIGAGMADGLDAGDNAKAAFLTRGIAEIARLGVAVGADPLTFAGLTGLGDMVATCASRFSRNHFVGEELAKGRSLTIIQAGMSQVAEGIVTTQAARELGRRIGVELPITDQVYSVLFEAKPALDAIAALMGREATHELVALRSLLETRSAIETPSN